MNFLNSRPEKQVKAGNLRQIGNDLRHRLGSRATEANNEFVLVKSGAGGAQRNPPTVSSPIRRVTPAPRSLDKIRDKRGGSNKVHSELSTGIDRIIAGDHC